jgi:hypothetical protein
MVDYSKWDRLAANLSDDEDDADDGYSFGQQEANTDANTELGSLGARQSRPRVTELDSSTGNRVEIGPAGVRIIDHTAHSAPSSSSVETDSGRCEMGALAVNATGISQHTIDLFTGNGYCETNYYWSQTKHEAVFRFRVRSSVKGKDVVITLNKAGVLSLSVGSELLLQKSMSYDVVRNEDGCGCPFDWELKHYDGEKFVEVVFVKKSPIANAAIWWTKVFNGDHEIDLRSITGRDSRNISNANAWDDAHSLFRSRVAEMEPISLDVDT